MSNPTIDNIIHVYTDGACSGNPGPGGWGIVLTREGKRLERSGGSTWTTNNQMELTAAIRALEILRDRHPEKPIVLVTDSQYVKKGITEWIHGWKKNGWRTASRQPVKNAELWEQLDLLTQALNVSWEWVKGHSGHPENERADQLAVAAIPR